MSSISALCFSTISPNHYQVLSKTEREFPLMRSLEQKTNTIALSIARLHQVSPHQRGFINEKIALTIDILKQANEDPSLPDPFSQMEMNDFRILFDSGKKDPDDVWKKEHLPILTNLMTELATKLVKQKALFTKEILQVLLFSIQESRYNFELLRAILPVFESNQDSPLLIQVVQEAILNPKKTIQKSGLILLLSFLQMASTPTLQSTWIEEAEQITEKSFAKHPHIALRLLTMLLAHGKGKEIVDRLLHSDTPSALIKLSLLDVLIDRESIHPETIPLLKKLTRENLQPTEMEIVRTILDKLSDRNYHTVKIRGRIGY